MISFNLDTLALLLLSGGMGVAVSHFWIRRQAEPPTIVPATTPSDNSTDSPDEEDKLPSGSIFDWVDNLPDSAIILNQRRRVIKANAGSVAILGPIPEGANIDLYLRQPQALEALDEALQLGTVAERELLLLSPHERIFQIRAAAFDTYCLVTLHDMTRQRLTDRMRVDFVANASHELRTPLATLIGFIETLQTGAAEDAPTRDRFLTIMNSEAQRMVRLIDDLLSLSRIELDKYVRPIAPLALTPVVEDVHNSLLMRLSDDSRNLFINIPDNLPDVVADRDQILQVLHNLINNAIKYGRSGTAINIDLAIIDAETIELCVRDEGDGVLPEHIPRLTERFYRVDTARSREMGGTGLGLAIVKHIVERHRGQLRIESEFSKGTAIRFTLPIASAASVAAAAPDSPDAPDS
jgi:two-component system, OmpR family, phosphate regulon sensor histidine kinase PhoR